MTSTRRRAMAEVFELVGGSEPGRGARAARRPLREMLELVGLESLAELEEGADAEARGG